MKIAGAILLSIGLLLGIYSLSMDVGVEVPAANYGYGVETPAMRVANIDRIEQRRNFNMLAGALIIGGILLLGFGAVAQKNAPVKVAKRLPTESPAPRPVMDPAAAVSVSICPKCRSMSSDSEKVCRCGHEFA